MCLKIETFYTQKYLISSGFCRSVFRKIRCYREAQNKRNHPSCASTHFKQHCVAFGVHVTGRNTEIPPAMWNSNISTPEYQIFSSHLPLPATTPFCANFPSGSMRIASTAGWVCWGMLNLGWNIFFLELFFFFVFDVGLLSFYALLLIWLKMQTALATKTNETTARFYACYSVPQRYMRMATQKVSFVRQDFVMSITGNRRTSGAGH